MSERIHDEALADLKRPIGNRIEYWRRHRTHMTRTALARRINCRTDTVYQIEKHGRLISRAWVWKIAVALGCSGAALYPGRNPFLWWLRFGETMRARALNDD